jgi:hypothetical protein
MVIRATFDFRGKIGQEITNICLQINDGIELGRGGHTFDVYEFQMKLVNQHKPVSPE